VITPPLPSAPGFYGPPSGHKIQDISGGGGVMYHNNIFTEQMPSFYQAILKFSSIFSHLCKPAISRQSLDHIKIFTEQIISFYHILLKFSSTFSHSCKPAISRPTLEHNNIFTEQMPSFYQILLKFSSTFSQ
jgi:hypothetical protein